LHHLAANADRRGRQRPDFAGSDNGMIPFEPAGARFERKDVAVHRRDAQVVVVKGHPARLTGEACGEWGSARIAPQEIPVPRIKRANGDVAVNEHDPVANDRRYAIRALIERQTPGEAQSADIAAVDLAEFPSVRRDTTGASSAINS